jgi:hypothetical protein
MTIVVSGGTVSTDGAYTVRTFEDSGTLTVAGGTLTNVQYLLVAGGGPAAVPAVTYTAGGGAGGVLTGNVDIASGSYPVIVGNVSNNSSFMNIIANGGGQGGHFGNGFSGGSGGGGAVQGTMHLNFLNFVGGENVAGQGNLGGAPGLGGYPPGGPGGGGGAGGPGGPGSTDGVGGAGGHGMPSTITGNLVYYAGGGSGFGPNGIGPNSPGYTSHGAGGGYDLADGPTYYKRLDPCPGVLIIRYPTPGGAGPDPATNTGGIALTYIAGLPQNLYPGVSLAGSAEFSGGANAQFVIQTTATYGVPAGFTFLNSWTWSRYDPTWVAVTTTSTANDTATANSAHSNAAAFGNITIAPGSKVMFSVNHSVYSGNPESDGVGAGSITAVITGPQPYLGSDNQALSVYDDGTVWTNGNSLPIGPYAAFETAGQIIDVAVDTVNNKLWYRVAGGAWQG